MGLKIPKFEPDNQTLDNYLTLVQLAFTAEGVTEENRKVSILLTHVPTKYFDDVCSLIAPKSPSDLKFDEVVTFLKTTLQADADNCEVSFAVPG